MLPHAGQTGARPCATDMPVGVAEWSFLGTMGTKNTWKHRKVSIPRGLEADRLS